MKIAIAALLAASALWSQQAPPRPPTIPLTATELEAIPLVAPHNGRTIKKELFDGKTLTGWQGNPEWWSVQDGAIRGKFNDKVPTSFLFTNENYSDFRLTLASKMAESDNHAGVAFWSEIIERAGDKWYTRGPLVVFPKPSMWDYFDAKGIRVFKTTTDQVTSQHDWIEVEILVQGNRVRTAMNGVEVMDWREADPTRVKEGPIGVQLHAWTGPQEVLYKDVVVETFPKQNKLITVKR